MNLTDQERSILSGATGTGGDRMAMEIVTEAARMLGAERLVPISSSHVDGCLYNGDSGVLFCERLVAAGAGVAVPTTTNVGSLNLFKPGQVGLPAAQRRMAYRLMVAYGKMGCIPSWTCAPYQREARPVLGQQIAWGESNAVAFANTALGARTNRYGDFLDIACAISARARLLRIAPVGKSNGKAVDRRFGLAGVPVARRCVLRGARLSGRSPHRGDRLRDRRRAGRGA